LPRNTFRNQFPRLKSHHIITAFIATSGDITRLSRISCMSIFPESTSCIRYMSKNSFPMLAVSISFSGVCAYNADPSDPSRISTDQRTLLSKNISNTKIPPLVRAIQGLCLAQGSASLPMTGREAEPCISGES
jgi:hypothetical protein